MNPPPNELMIELLGKGLVPHTRLTPDGQKMAEIWWEHPTNNTAARMGWPEALCLISLLIFALLMIKGVPWT